MRVAIFTASAIGYVDNPEALYARGLAWGLAGRGHAVRMLEERRNPALRRTLEAVGASASRQVYEQFPGILFHSFEPRSGARLMEWVARELSLADLAVAVDGVADELARWIANLDHRNLTRAFVSYRPDGISAEQAAGLELERFDLLLASGAAPAGLEWQPIEACLAPQDRRAVPAEYLPRELLALERDPEDVAAAFEIAVLRGREWKS